MGANNAHKLNLIYLCVICILLSTSLNGVLATKSKQDNTKQQSQ